MSQLTLPNILCCICGLQIQTNPTNMCVSCLHDRVDITQDLTKKLTIHSCRSCGRFLGPPWQSIALESKELMVLCLRKVTGLNRMKVVDATWIWTEPHSMRLKIKLTVQKEIMNGAVMQQCCLVEFVIRNQQCRNCEASYAQGAWRAVVQVRQRASHKRTFLYLEQLILKHEAHGDCVKIVTFRDGIDFYFNERNQALRFIDFLGNCVPIKTKYSRKLISADQSNGTADFKHNHLIDIAPICKDDLLILPKELAQKQSNINPLVLVKRVGAGIYVIDPITSERTDVNSEKYWRYSFHSMLSSRQLIKFVVLSVEPLLEEQRPSSRMKKSYVKENDHSSVQTSRIISKLGECVVMRERDLGKNDTQFTCITHLGPLLSAGDTVLGYDLASTNLNVDEKDLRVAEKMNDLPDVVLVRKCYSSRSERFWELKKFDDAVHENNTDMNKKDKAEYQNDLEDFLQQLESDKEMRSQINLYKKKTSTVDPLTNVNDPQQLDEEEVRLDELLDDMSLNGESVSSNANNEDIQILSISEAAHSNELHLNTDENNVQSSFDSSKFESKQFNFL